MSQVSVQRQGGWASPVMVSQYTRSVAEELAEQEFRRLHP